MKSKLANSRIEMNKKEKIVKSMGEANALSWCTQQPKASNSALS
jgi:hypothetical protein